MARQSAAALAVIKHETQDRISPPISLTPAQKSHWVAIVNARPADWFGPENAANLVQYCRHRVQADIIAKKLETFNPEWLDDDDGLKRYDKLSGMLERETRALNALMRSMRLTQQSLVRAEKRLPEQPKGKKPWQQDD